MTEMIGIVVDLEIILNIETGDRPNAKIVEMNGHEAAMHRIHGTHVENDEAVAVAVARTIEKKQRSQYNDGPMINTPNKILGSRINRERIHLQQIDVGHISS